MKLNSPLKKKKRTCNQDLCKDLYVHVWKVLRFEQKTRHGKGWKKGGEERWTTEKAKGLTWCKDRSSLQRLDFGKTITCNLCWKQGKQETKEWLYQTFRCCRDMCLISWESIASDLHSNSSFCSSVPENVYHQGVMLMTGEPSVVAETVRAEPRMRHYLWVPLFKQPNKEEFSLNYNVLDYSYTGTCNQVAWWKKKEHKGITVYSSPTPPVSKARSYLEK